ncbi:ABC transporter substrate-binding protein [Pilibacter termitis]|nr:ABC transporter substrate-binding protein [Pilibacter termitis]
MKKLATVFTVFASVAVLAGCSAAPGGESKGNKIDKEILIGVNEELSGAVAAYGNAEKNAIELAVDEINKDGGIDGKKIKLVVKDNKSTTDEAASVSSNLTVNSKVVAIIGPATSGAVKASIPNVTKASVPLVTPSGTDDNLTVANGKVNEDIFRSCFQDSFQGTILAKYANDTLQSKKAAVFYDNSSDYAAGITEAFNKEYKGEVVVSEKYQAGDKDFNAQLTSIKSKKFDVLVIPGYYAEAGLIIKQARSMGIDTAILGPDGFGDPALAEIAGNENTNNVFFTAHFSSKAAANDKVDTFLKAYKEKYNEEASQFAALGYDAVYMVKQAIEKTEAKTSVDVAKGLAELKDFEGVTGKISIDKNHNPEKSAVIVGLKDGKENSAEIVNP